MGPVSLLNSQPNVSSLENLYLAKDMQMSGVVRFISIG